MESLVSIIIATYNSSSYIIETLESIAKQTWKEIELIITDDCSIDNTTEVCGKWLNENGNRFVHSEVITFHQNTGVGANANRGLNAANGEWIKFLGADDTLKQLCIEDNMAFIAANPEVRVLFSRIEVFRGTFEPANLIVTIPEVPYDANGILSPDRNAGSQYKMLLVSDRIHFTPSVFLHRGTMLSMGGYDERFRMLEDYPLWLNLTKNGHKLYFMDNVTVCYRQHSDAINNTGIPHLINPNYFKNEDFRRLCTYPFLPADVRIDQQFTWYASQIFKWNLLNKNIRLNRYLPSLLTNYLNPFRYFIRLRKMLNKDLKNNEFYM